MWITDVLHTGLIISLSLLLAAGLAIYENEQVRHWVDESRRKVAIALHSLGDEVAPQQSESRDASPDASTREAEDPEAVERRRKARQEILERGRILEDRRRSKRSSQGKTSFDDLVDKDGSLKAEGTTATTTAAEPQAEESGLRNRHTEFQAAALGSAFANPFADEMHLDSPAAVQNETHNMDVESIPTRRFRTDEMQVDSPPTVRGNTEEPPSRSRTPTLPISPASPPVPPKPAAYQPQRLLIDTDEVSNHPSESLLDLTPTTSASSAAEDLAELNGNHHSSQANYWSVNEWAENHAASFYSPPRSEAAGIEERMENQSERSEVGTGEHASQAGVEDMEVMSDDEAGISTPSSWTEVGSQVSEDY